MKPIYKQILKFLFFFLLGLLVIWWFQRGLTIEEKAEILEAFKSSNLLYLLLSAFFALLSNVFRCLRWQMLLAPIVKKPTFLNTFLSVLVAYFVNLAVPRLGELIRCSVLYKYEKIPVQKSLGTVITERIVDLICFGLIFLLLLFIEYNIISAYLFEKTGIGSNSISNTILYVGIGGFIFAIVSFIVIIKNRKRIYNKVKTNKFALKLYTVLAGFVEGLLSLKKVKNPFLFVMYSICIWLCYWAMLGFALISIPELLPHITPLIALIALEMGTIGVMLTPGGIGVYPVIIAETLQIYDINKVLGYAAGWLSWSSQTIMIILSGITALCILPYINRAK